MGRNRGFKAGGPSGPASDPSTVRPGSGTLEHMPQVTGGPAGNQKAKIPKSLGDQMKQTFGAPGPQVKAVPGGQGWNSGKHDQGRPGVGGGFTGGTPGPQHGFGGIPSPAGSTPTPNGPSAGGVTRPPVASIPAAAPSVPAGLGGIAGALGMHPAPAPAPAPAYDHSTEHPFSGNGRGRFGQ